MKQIIMKDTIEDSLCYLRDVPYKGNFTINYHTKEQLILLQRFFGVRRTKFDMALLDNRESLLTTLTDFNYDKNSDN